MTNGVPPRFETALGAVAAEVEAVLDGLVGPDAGAGEVVRPPRLVAAMRHAVLNGGKRLRPYLTVAAARALGRGAGALRVGAAVELLHCYSLVHDDLPAMDDDDLRRGQPTLHRAYDEATAILAGDALLTLAFAVLADPATHDDPAVRSELVLGLSVAAGIGGMVGGQMLDLTAEGRFAADGAPLALADADIRRLQAMKTGALLRFAVEAGAIVAGATPEARQALRAYGETVGLAFQIADDLLDVEATPEQVGKATAKDAARGKATLVSLHGVDAMRRTLDELIAQADAALAGLGPAADSLRAAARFVARRSH